MEDMLYMGQNLTDQKEDYVKYWKSPDGYSRVEELIYLCPYTRTSTYSIGDPNRTYSIGKGPAPLSLPQFRRQGRIEGAKRDIRDL